MGDRQTPHHEIKGYVKNADYAAQSVLAAVTDDTPAAVTLDEGEVIGRLAGGDVGAVSAADLVAAGLGAPDPGQVLTESGGAPAWADALDVTVDGIATGTTPAISIGALLSAAQSAGYYSGGVLSQDSESHNLLYTAIYGLIKTNPFETSENALFKLSAGSIDYTTLVDESTNWIYVYYSTGVVGVGSTDDPSEIDGFTEFAIGIVYRSRTSLDILQCGQQIQNYSARNNDRLIERGVERISGSDISETGTRSIYCTAGRWYYGSVRFDTDLQNAANFEHYCYLKNSVWTDLTATNQINNTQYNDVSTPGAESLATLTTNRYGVHWVYQSFAGELSVVLGRGDYTSVTAANAAQPPSTLPNYLSSFATLIGKVIIRKSASTFTSIESAFDTLFVPEGVATHNNLAGLQGGTTDEYYHLSVVQLRDLSSEVRVTADDTEIKLTSASYRKQVLTGSGVMYSLNFGDTTSYPVGFEFEIVNNSANFVRARSNHATSESSASWDTIPPYGTLKARCIDPTVTGGASGGEKEGTWATTLIDKALADPRYGYNGITDFVGSFSGNTYYSEGGWIGAMSSGSAIMNTANDPSGKQGIARLQVAGVASYALLHNSRYVILGGAAIRRSFHVSKSNANAATDETTMRYGLGSNLTGGEHTNGVSFLNDFTNYGDVYVCRTVAAAGSNDTYPTSIVPAVTPNYDTLTIEVAASGTRVDYFINRKLVRTHSTAANIPSGIALATTFGATKVSNTTSRDLYADWAQVQSYPTTLRG